MHVWQALPTAANSVPLTCSFYVVVAAKHCGVKVVHVGNPLALRGAARQVYAGAGGGHAEAVPAQWKERERAGERWKRGTNAFDGSAADSLAGSVCPRVDNSSNSSILAWDGCVVGAVGRRLRQLPCTAAEDTLGQQQPSQTEATCESGPLGRASPKSRQGRGSW